MVCLCIRGDIGLRCRATVNHFIELPLFIPEEVLTELEKRGVSSEWDMAPLLLASYWTDRLSYHPLIRLPSDVLSAATEINRQCKAGSPAPWFIPEFSLVPSQYPSETAMQAGCFASIPDGLRKNLLTETRNIYKSCTMRVFQHFTLGSENFTKTYNLPRRL